MNAKFKKIVKYLIKLRCCLVLWVKAKAHKQLFILISTPFYGNVGDHAILLQEKRIIHECGIKKQIVEFTSYEYNLIFNSLNKLIRKQDVIIIDGGGNFGDTWPETTYQIINIIKDYSENNVLIFPESWYYSNTEKGKKVLQDTQDAFLKNPNVVLYARDTWSFTEMTKSLVHTVVRCSYDTVLLQGISQSRRSKKVEIVGLCIREDKELKNSAVREIILKCLKSRMVNIEIIKNDCYKHIPKAKRKAYVNKIFKQYTKCDLIITDRFHGFIFSLVIGKPCVVLDNATGKIIHFYKDIMGDIKGYHCIEDGATIEKTIEKAFEEYETHYSDEFIHKIEKYKEDIKNTILQWRIH